MFRIRRARYYAANVSYRVAFSSQNYEWSVIFVTLGCDAHTSGSGHPLRGKRLRQGEARAWQEVACCVADCGRRMRSVDGPAYSLIIRLPSPLQSLAAPLAATRNAASPWPTLKPQSRSRTRCSLFLCATVKSHRRYLSRSLASSRTARPGSQVPDGLQTHNKL